MKLKQILIPLFGLLLFPFAPMNAQEVKADDVLGIWLNEDKDAHIKIFMEDEKFNGKIVWLKNPNDSITGLPRLDKNNENEKQRSRPVMGLLLLRGFEFDDDEWEDGKIYDPKNGKDYKCYMEFEDETDKNTLKVRGFIGFSMLGRTTYWTRVE